MAACGLWVARSALWAAVVDDRGVLLEQLAITRDDDARWGLLSHLDAHHGLDCALVLTDEHARIDELANLALERRMDVWLAPWRTVDAVRVVTALATGPPKRTAAALARMTVQPLFRAQLRRLWRDPRQLSML